MKTSYNLDFLNPSEAREIHDSIVQSYINFVKDKLYSIINPVNINSWVDSSVYLIWAPISVMKPYIVNKNIPKNGLALAQPSIRTHNTKILLDKESWIKWWSCFTWLANIANYSEKEKSFIEIFDFLQNYLSVDAKNIKINISSKDEDILKLLDLVDKNILVELDSKPELYYKHKYWLWDIVWRNCNIALREKWSDNFNDIWNFIIIENWEEKYWLEVALWASTIMKELYDLNHTLDTSIINSIYLNEWNAFKLKLQDSIISSILLFNEWIRANSSNTKWRILKKYIDGIKLYSELLWINILELKNIINIYEKKEYKREIRFFEYFQAYYKNK